MLKRLFLASIAALFGLTAGAEEFSEGTLNFEITGENTCRLIASPEAGGSLSLPPVLIYGNKEFTLTAIAPEALAGNKDLEALLIPSTVKEIGKAVARRCTGLRIVEFGDGLELLGDEAFVECTALEAAVLPDGLKSVPRRCFYGAGALREVRLGAATEQIESQAFGGCRNLESVVSMAKVPPSVAPYGFDRDAIGRAVLTVPVGSRQAYMAEDAWSRFRSIVESDYGGQKVSLTLMFPSGSVVTMEPAGSRTTFEVSVGDGWEVAGLYFNGADVTGEITPEGYYTTPELLEASILSLTLRSSAGVGAPAVSRAAVRRLPGYISVDGVAETTAVRVYAPDGTLIYSGRGSRRIPVATDSPVILVAGGETFKL